MKEINSLEDVLLYKFYDENEMFIIKDKGLIYNNTLITSRSFVYGSVIEKKNIFHLIEKDNKVRLKDLITDETFLVDSSLTFNSYYQNSIIGLKQTFDKKFNLCKFYLDTKETRDIPFLYENITIMWANDNYAYIIKKMQSDSFCFYNHRTETTLWQLDALTLGLQKFTTTIGVFEDVLIISGENHFEINGMRSSEGKIIGINIHSGLPAWTRTIGQAIDEDNPEVIFEGSTTINFYQWNNGDTILKSLGFRYCELDSQTGIPTYLDFKDQIPNGNTLAVRATCLVDNLLYFSGIEPAHSHPNHIGAFDINTKKVLWLHIFDYELGFRGLKYSEPRASATKVYALDNNDTLHIFEREEIDGLDITQ